MTANGVAGRGERRSGDAGSVGVAEVGGRRSGYGGRWRGGASGAAGMADGDAG